LSTTAVCNLLQSLNNSMSWYASKFEAFLARYHSAWIVSIR
jgi:hypothetical protein